MAGRWLGFHEVKDLFDEQLALPGAFGPNSGRAQLYSGPARDTVLPAIIGITETNQDKAKRQAKQDGAILMDTSPIGDYATNFQGIGLYPYFAAQTHRPYQERIDDADNIMRHLSQKLVESLWGRVSTAVCGAGKDRVFYDTEIPTMAFIIPELIKRLLKSDDIESVNEISIDLIRGVCLPADYDAAFDLICRGELNLAFQKAADTRDVHIFQDFIERSEFYMVERELTWRAGGKSIPALFQMSPPQRADWRRTQMQEFVIGNLGTLIDDLNAALPGTPSSSVFLGSKRAGPKPA